MFDFHEKRKIRNVLYSKVVVGVLLCASVLLSISAYNRFTVAEEMKVKLESRRVALEELEQRAQMLTTKVEYLENERGIEEEVRNRFDVAREGEKVVILIDPPSTKKDDKEVAQDDFHGHEPKESFFNFLLFWK